MAIKVTAPVRIDISAGWPDSDPYRKDFGGYVLNGAINFRVSAYFDSHLTIQTGNVPPHSGLGTSGALRSVELVASNPLLVEDRTDLINRVHKFENDIIGHRAGIQDQAAAIYGGVNLWEFKSNGAIRRYEIEKNEADSLEKNIVLVYTGESHLSGDIHDLVFKGGNYEKNIPKFERMSDISLEIYKNLKDCEKIGELINETWDLQRGLHDSIETDFMETLQRNCQGRYLGARATGAGAGGSFIFYTLDKNSLTSHIEKIITSSGQAKILPFKFDYEGIKVEKPNKGTFYGLHRK